MEYVSDIETSNEKELKYLRAKERLDEVRKFYTKLVRSLLLIVFLAGVNYFLNEWRYMWFLWAAFGIGIGLVSNAIKVFGVNPFFGRDWEDRKIREFMEKDEQNKWN